MKTKIKEQRDDLVFFYPENIFQKIISFFDGKYCHCGIILGDGLYLSMTRKGVQVLPYKHRKYDVYEIDIDKQDKEKLISFLLSQMAIVKYDFMGLVSFVFTCFSQNPLRFYCSEFISWGLFYIGLLPDRLQLSPSQLANQEFLRRKL